MTTLTSAQEADRAILVEAIAYAAQCHADAGQADMAQRLTRFAATVLGVDGRTVDAWRNGAWELAHARASDRAIEAIRNVE